MPITNGNYRVVVDTLNRAFGDTEAAIDTVNSKLYELQPVPSNNVQRLRDMYFEMEGLLGSLEALGGDATSSQLL